MERRKTSDVLQKIVEHYKIESCCKEIAKELKIPILTIRAIIKKSTIRAIIKKSNHHRKILLAPSSINSSIFRCQTRLEGPDSLSSHHLYLYSTLNKGLFSNWIYDLH